MSPFKQPETDYSEDALVEQPAIEIFSSLRWRTVNAFREQLGAAGTLGRETEHEVVLLGTLMDCLRKLNRGLDEGALRKAADEITQDRSVMSAERANQEVYQLLKDGVKVQVKRPDGTEETETVRVIDWDNPENNDFLLVSQLWVRGQIYRRRCDLVGFVNGIPLLFVELKAMHKHLKKAYDENLRDYRFSIPQLFWYNGFIVLSNGRDSKVGSTTAGWEHFAHWKKIKEEEEPPSLSLETMIHGTCAPARLLDIVENFTVYKEAKGGLIKLVGKYHQYFGVNRAVQAVRDIKENKGRLGVFWHTQGSGKSLPMICFSQKVLRKIPGNWTFVMVTDRDDLDDQLYKEFAACGVVTEKEIQAKSGEGLKLLLREDHRYVFTLIQKFRAEKGKTYEELSAKSDVIVVTDEAHRSQYDVFAMNMRSALPNAAFIGFTGTPLMAGEEKTKSVFGDYVSIYNFTQSIEDKATVPLFYENRVPELELTNVEFNDDMEEALEGAALGEEEEEKLERDFAKQYQVITRDDRLETIAEDIVRHFMRRGVMGKAIVVAIDKVTAGRMYDKVQKHWQAALIELSDKLAIASGDEEKYLARKLAFMRETGMALIVSESQNEVETMQKKGVDIIPHRLRMKKEDLETKFKNDEDPLRIVFVCAMWLTGFDVPSCNTVYLDKPMRNHTLMQTIARANRVFGEDKQNGTIVDYANVFGNLQKALAIYAAPTEGGGEDGKTPIRDKDELVGLLHEAAEAARQFCNELAIDLTALQTAVGLEKARLLNNAVEAAIRTEEDKNKFLAIAGYVTKLYKAVKPDPSAHEFLSLSAALSVIAESIRALRDPVDVSEVMRRVEDLLDESTAATGFIIRAQENEPGVVGEPTMSAGTGLPDHMLDLSKLDFEKLKARFNTCGKRTEAEKLQGMIERKLRSMVQLNRSRMNYQETYQRMLDEYHSGQQSTEFHFAKLMELAEALTEEEKRGVKEGLSEEELAIFDLLTKAEPNLTKKEETEVKAVAKELLNRLKHELLVLDWRNRQQTRAAVRLAIEQELDRLPAAFEKEVYEEKCGAVYQHVYDSYFGAGQSVYGKAA